jgi:anti-sigma regulatory factor (Ser/Thr protein kinase)
MARPSDLGWGFTDVLHIEVPVASGTFRAYCRLSRSNRLRRFARTEEPFVHDQVREEKGLRPGGYGIQLAQSLVDELVYNEAHNEVVMVKYLN